MQKCSMAEDENGRETLCATEAPNTYSSRRQMTVIIITEQRSANWAIQRARSAEHSRSCCRGSCQRRSIVTKDEAKLLLVASTLSPGRPLSFPALPLLVNRQSRRGTPLFANYQPGESDNL